MGGQLQFLDKSSHPWFKDWCLHDSLGPIGEIQIPAINPFLWTKEITLFISIVVSLIVALDRLHLLNFFLTRVNYDVMACRKSVLWPSLGELVGPSVFFLSIRTNNVVPFYFLGS